MRKIAAFILRGWLTEISYRTAFVLELGSAVLAVATVYFLARVVGTNPHNPYLRAYGGDYLVFVVVGIVFQSLVTTSLAAFSRTVRGEQIMGTLEFLFLSDTPLWRVLIYASVWDFLSTLLNTMITLGVAIAIRPGLGRGHPGDQAGRPRDLVRRHHERVSRRRRVPDRGPAGAYSPGRASASDDARARCFTAGPHQRRVAVHPCSSPSRASALLRDHVAGGRARILLGLSDRAPRG